jgi:hypothetical protein
VRLSAAYPGTTLDVTGDPKTNPSDASESGPERRADVQSDPAKGAEDRTDWSDEGGATPEGPADE